MNCLVVPPQALICTTPGIVSRRRVDDVILQRPQIGQAEMRGTDELVAVDLADQTGLLDLGDLIAGQS